MILALRLPRIHELMTSATVEAVYARVGTLLPVGAKLADITVDLSAAAAQDCPPISHYRLVLRERLWLRALSVARGDDVATGATIALFSTASDEPIDAAPGREVRTSIAGILAQSEAWQESGP